MDRGPRALLTDGERDAIRDDTDMTPNTRHSHLSRIRQKIYTRLGDDLDLLRENQSELAADIEAVVCQQDSDASDLETRISHLESRVRSLERRLAARIEVDDEA